MGFPNISRGLLALLYLSIGLGTGLVSAQGDEPDTGEHPDWPRWCGKVYKTGYPSFEPGGHTVAPLTDGSTYLHLQFKPRYSLYLSTETKASFVVNAALSPWFGEEYDAKSTGGHAVVPDDNNNPEVRASAELDFSINLASTDAPLVKDRIKINATGVEFRFNLKGIKPRVEPYEVVLRGSTTRGDGKKSTYSAKSELLYLPDNPSGSATKIDNLKGGLLFKNAKTNGAFVPLLPYGYYGLYNGSNATAASDEFVRGYTNDGKGLNGIISLAGFADTNPVYDSMDEQGLRFMFDLRGSYKNLTETEQRVNTIKHHTSLFAYWTADEPDGWQVPFDKTPAAQALIHKLDPYHPVAITLNCQDYYFAEYAVGGDILMEDVYPIGINSTFSKWGTVCNATLGDCGCDNCGGGVLDVSSRLDDLAQYEEWLGRWPLPKFHNPQVFHGEDYWARDPTAAEAVAMNALAFNRGATGIFGWTWPSSDELFDVHSEMAGVVTNAPVRDFLLSGRPEKLGVKGHEILDVAYWIVGERIMVSVVNPGDDAIEGPVSIGLPISAKTIDAVALGGLGWQLQTGRLTVNGLPAMSTSFVILKIKTAN